MEDPKQMINKATPTVEIKKKLSKHRFKKDTTDDSEQENEQEENQKVEEKEESDLEKKEEGIISSLDSLEQELEHKEDQVEKTEELVADQAKEIENLKAQMESMETHIEELSKKIIDQTEPLPEKDLNPDDQPGEPMPSFDQAKANIERILQKHKNQEPPKMQEKRKNNIRKTKAKKH